MIYLLERVFAFVSVCVYVWLCVSLSLSLSVCCSCAKQPRQHKIRCCLGLISVQYGVTPWFAEMRVHIVCISQLKLM